MSEVATTRKPGRKAKDSPVFAASPEINTADMTVGQMPAIDLPDSGPIVRENEEIVALEAPMHKDYMDELRFMEEPVEIMLMPSSDKFQPKFVTVACNGVEAWIEINKPQTVKRKYVEILARSKPIDIQTRHEDATVERPDNQVMRMTRVKYPFSVLKDTAKGREWLVRVMAEQ